MKLGLCAFMVVGRGSGIQPLGYGATLENTIKKTAELGMEGIELGDAIGPDNPTRPFQLPDKAYRKKIREMIESHGLTLTNIQSDDRFCDPVTHRASYGGQVGRPTLMAADYRLQLARDLGTDLVRIDLVASADRTVPLGRQWAQGIEFIKEYCIMAEDYGITLAIHNHGWLSVLDRLQLIKDCGSPENLKLQLDVINCANRGEDLFETTRICKDYLSKSMHVKDQRVMFKDDNDVPAEARRGHTFRNFLCNIGEGNLVDWEAYLRLLKEIKYDGFLNIESFTHRQDIGIPDWISYEVGTAYLRKVAKKVGY